MDLQRQFNEIVLENKKLKEKEATYEPRIAEFESCRGKLTDVEAFTSQVCEIIS